MRSCRRLCGVADVRAGEQDIFLAVAKMRVLTSCARYKNHRVDGKVTAVWGGSVLSYMEMIRHIRPEDFEIKYRSRNRFR